MMSRCWPLPSQSSKSSVSIGCDSCGCGGLMIFRWSFCAYGNSDRSYHWILVCYHEVVVPWWVMTTPACLSLISLSSESRARPALSSSNGLTMCPPSLCFFSCSDKLRIIFNAIIIILIMFYYDNMFDGVDLWFAFTIIKSKIQSINSWIIINKKSG